MGAVWKYYGADLFTEADPDQLSATHGSPGAVRVKGENRSVVPLTVNVQALLTSDPHVADVDYNSAQKSFHLPGGRSGVPARAHLEAGAWLPKGSGSATISSRVELVISWDGSTAQGTPTDDVRVG